MNKQQNRKRNSPSLVTGAIARPVERPEPYGLVRPQFRRNGTDMLDTDGTMEDVATKLVVVMENGAEDKINAENAASVLLLVCLYAIGESTKNGRQHKPPRRA